MESPAECTISFPPASLFPISEEPDQEAKLPAPGHSRKPGEPRFFRPHPAGAYTVFVRQIHFSNSEIDSDLDSSERALMTTAIWAVMSPADRHPYALAANAELQSSEA
jgi:hypothetical protein